MQFLKIKQITNYPRIDMDPGTVLEWPRREALRMIEAKLVEEFLEPIPQPTKPVTERTTARKATETRG